MDLSWAEIRVTRGIRPDLTPETLELATSDVGEVFPVGAGCRALVEVHRDRQLAAISQKSEVDSALDALKAKLSGVAEAPAAPPKEKEKISSAFDEK